MIVNAGSNIINLHQSFVLKNPFELERSHCFLSCTWKVRPNMPCGHEKIITDIVCKHILQTYFIGLCIISSN